MELCGWRTEIGQERGFFQSIPIFALLILNHVNVSLTQKQNKMKQTKKSFKNCQRVNLGDKLLT